MSTYRFGGGHWLAAFTAAWITVDATAPPDQQLTDGARRFHTRHPILWPVLVTATAVHLLDGYRKLGVPQLDP